jgi:WD40 repeat protein
MSVVAPPSPFKGLAAFEDTELDALLFCGREREREVVVANLLASRLTVLYGASGVGKSSLLRAAVAHSLRGAHDAAVVVFASWAGDPRAGLGEAIDEAVGIESNGTLTERLRASGEVYAILDQFEEYFLYHEHDQFADELAEAIAEPGLRANFLLGLREDALAKLDAFKGRIPNLFANYLRLDHLDLDGARAAILGPVERWNELTGESVRVEPELVEAVLDQVAAGKVDVGRAGRGGVEADEERIEAPYLQLVLERLWEAERDRGSDVVRLATLQELGGAEAIVRAHLERALGGLGPSQQNVAATIFGHLVTPSGSKIAHRPGDLAQYAAVREAEVRPVLEALGRERIVRAVDGAGGEERYEIFHDVLADGVLAWRARRELERDREAAHARQRRLTVIAVAALLALAAMTAVAIWAFTERSHARTSAREARARALEATALAELPSDPERALADALRAARSSSSGRAAEVLRQALLQAHLERVLRKPGPVATAAGGRLTARIGAGGRVSIVDRRTGRVLRVLPSKGVHSARLSPDGKLLATADYRGTELWNPRTGRHIGVLDDGAKTKRMNDAEFSPDGLLLAAAGEDGALRIWDVAHRTRLFYFPGHTNPLFAVAWSPDGRFVADASGDRTAFVWEVRGVQQGERVAELVGHRGAVTSVAFSRDGRSLRTASADGTTRIWDTRFEQDFQLLGSQRGGALTASFGGGGRLIVSVGADGTARIWSVRDRRLLHTLRPGGGVNDARLSPNGRLVLTAGPLGAALWYARTGGGQRRLPSAESLSVARFSPDARTIVTGSSNGDVQLWRTRGGSLVRSERQAGAVTDADFAADGKTVVTAGTDGATVWEIGARRRHLLRIPGGATSVAFAPDGSEIATAGADGAARLWDTRSGRLLHVLRASKVPLTDVVFSPDGRLLLTTRKGIKGNVETWNVRTGKLRHEMVGVFGTVATGAFSPDGRWIVTAGPISAALWQTGAERPYLYLRGGKTNLHFLTAVTFGPEGRLILSASQDGSVGLYRCEVCGNLKQLIAIAERRLSASR